MVILNKLSLNDNHAFWFLITSFLQYKYTEINVEQEQKNEI